MITIDTHSTQPALRRPWKNGIAIGRAYDLTRQDLIEHLRWLQKEVGFRTCRFHAVFHDDMDVVRRRSDGALVYQWHHVDKVYDTLLSLGMRPFVELNPMPAALASGSTTMFDYEMNITPPRHWEEWGDLVRAFATHCIGRYGLPEVSQWNFEVWNEPNLSCFWTGTKEDYFHLYAHAARALKSVHPDLRVGGPASSKASWLADLIDYCTANSVPIDFLSTHLYPQDEFVDFSDRAASPHALGQYFPDTVRGAKKTVATSALPHLPIHWTEWNTQLATHSSDVTWCENRFVDSLHGASFVARHMVELDEVAENFSYWVASDIFAEGPQPLTPFSHTYGLLTVHGLPKATANAFRLLERLRGSRLGLALPDAPAFCGGVATREGDSIHLLLWHDTPPEVLSAPDWTDTISVKIPSATGSSWVATTTCIRASAGSAFESWERIGRPINPSPAQLAMLRTHAEPACDATALKSSADGLSLPFTLRRNEVLHVEFCPAGIPASPKSDLLTPAQAAKFESQLGEKSR